MSQPDTLPPSIADLGQFETDRAIGSPALPGGAEHEGGVDRVSAAGSNIWGRADEFRFVGTRTSGDFVLSATIDFVGRGADPHRKACLMARTDDSTDAAYVDVAVHGDGLTSIQYRTARGAETSEVVATVRGVQQVELRRRGHYFSAWTRGVPITPEIRVDLPADQLVGIAVCSHRPDSVETVVFSDVTRKSTFATDRFYSVLEAIDVRTGARRPLDVFDRWVEAPNWLRDGRILFNCEGAMFERSPEGPITRIDTAAARSCNNDHGVSPDERTLAISDADDGQSRVFLVPIDGGEATLVTAERPSYWHGFAPDGARITYTAERNVRWGSSHALSTAATKPASPTPSDTTMAPNTRRTASTSTSTRTAPAACRSTGCRQPAVTRSRSSDRTRPTGFRTSHLTASRLCTSPTRPRSQDTRGTRKSKSS